MPYGFNSSPAHDDDEVSCSNTTNPSEAFIIFGIFTLPSPPWRTSSMRELVHSGSMFFNSECESIASFASAIIFSCKLCNAQHPSTLLPCRQPRPCNSFCAIVATASTLSSADAPLADERHATLGPAQLLVHSSLGSRITSSSTASRSASVTKLGTKA